MWTGGDALSWKRGSQSVDIELSRVQTKIEDWSEIFDGDNGMIRIFQTQEAVDDERDKERDKNQKRTLLICAICALLPILHDLPGWLHGLFK
jgi:hypothetical protein